MPAVFADFPTSETQVWRSSRISFERSYGAKDTVEVEIQQPPEGDMRQLQQSRAKDTVVAEIQQPPRHSAKKLAAAKKTDKRLGSVTLRRSTRHES